MNTFAFDGITSSRRVPGSQMEFSNVRALTGLPAAVQKILLVGQRLSTGTVAALTPKRITQVAEGAAFFGRGSIAAAMVARAIAANSSTELWAIGVDDNGAGTAATWTITLTGPATGAGTLAYLIAGQKVPVAVASGDSITAIATAIAAAVNALPDLPVTASSAVGVVTLTFRHKGTAGNDLPIHLNYFEGEVTPAGLTSVVAAAVAGATNPDLTTVFAAIGDAQYQTIALGFNDAANLSVADTEMLSRWGPGRQIDGRIYAGLSGSFSTCSTFGATRNGPFVTIVGAYKMPSPPWEIAAGVSGVAAFHLQIDPARPLTGLVVPGLLPPKNGATFIDSERNILLSNAISTFTVTAAGEFAIERLITTYRVNSLGFPDVSYLDITTIATLSYYRFSWRSMMAQKHGRVKLTADRIKSIRADTIALARDWEDAELMEDVDGFIAGLVLERDTTNRNQLNSLLVPDVVNPLLQNAARVEFIL